MEVAAFIAARGGSKSIKNKNIKPMNGRPLIYWSIDAAVGCPFIEKVFISTDSPEIRRAVIDYGNPNVIPIDRSAESASDTAPTTLAISEFALAYEFRTLVLIQATSPLNRSEYIAEGYGLIKDGYDSVLSVTTQKRFIWRDTAGGAVPVNYDIFNRPRRQEFEGYYVENGAFYITSRAGFIATNCTLGGRIGLVVMPEETYHEIDEPSDWIIVEELLKKHLGQA